MPASVGRHLKSSGVAWQIIRSQATPDFSLLASHWKSRDAGVIFLWSRIGGCILQVIDRRITGQAMGSGMEAMLALLLAAGQAGVCSLAPGE